MLEHQHVPEIEQTLADAGADPASFQLRFVPVSAPLSPGHPGDLLRRGAGQRDRRTAWPAAISGAYGGEPFVRFLDDRPPEVAAVSGSNYAEVGFTLGPRGGRRRGRWRCRPPPTT